MHEQLRKLSTIIGYTTVWALNNESSKVIHKKTNYHQNDQINQTDWNFNILKD